MKLALLSLGIIFYTVIYKSPVKCDFSQTGKEDVPTRYEYILLYVVNGENEDTISIQNVGDVWALGDTFSVATNRIASPRCDY